MASSLDRLAVEMLLDGNDAGLKRLADGLKKSLDVAMGRLCPVCGGSNVAVGDDQGVCDDCDNYFDIPHEVAFDNDGFPAN